jgi:AbrB family looped-hinge helix DNA binding protein
MPTAMVTFNGRITLPPQVRRQLGLRTGDNVDFVENDKGQFAIVHRDASIRDLKRFVSRPDQPPSIEQVDESVP